MINNGPILAPRRLFESHSNNGASRGHSNLVSDEVYICSSLLLMISWWLLYMAKGPKSDFNKSPGNGSNSGCILALQRLFESNLDNDHFPSHSNLVSDGVYIYLFRSPTYGILVVTILAKGLTPDFNNDPGNDLNRGCILALQRLFESDLNNGPSPSHSNLVSDRVYICSGLPLMVSLWVPYLPKGCRPTSIMA